MTSKRARRERDDLQSIPGVGPSLAQDLRDLGIQHVAELRGQDPERLYARLIAQRGVYQDRCVLYVFRCAVYFAETPEPQSDPERLKWWHWKDPQPPAPARQPRRAQSGLRAR
jgi:hypothetical protein